MRDIEFRAFCKSLNRMLSFEHLKEATKGMVDVANNEMQKRELKYNKLAPYGLFLPLEDDDLIFMQYTGLTDKNGTKIFEGDIVLSQEFRNKPFSKNYKSKRLIGVVEYYDRKLNDGKQIYESGYRVRFINDNEKSFYNCGAWSDFYDCEVIGNIFDNGELLNDD